MMPDTENVYAGLTNSQVCAIAHRNVTLTDDKAAFEKKLKARFSHALPTGIFAIHVKRFDDIRLNDVENFVDESGVHVFLRIQVGDQTKDLPTYYVDLDQKVKSLAVDHIRHFGVTISNNRKDAPHIKFILLGYVDFENQVTLAKVDLHIYDMLKNPYMSDTFEFARKGQLLATADVEMVFAYGSFGYGWSNQLQTPARTPAAQVAHSMFYRQQPPPERALDDVHDIATALPVGHPPFIPFTEKAEIGKTARELEVNIDVKDLSRTISDPTILLSKSRKRLSGLVDQYSALKSRKERLAFLTKLVEDKPLKGEETTMGAGMDGGSAIATAHDLTGMVEIMAMAPAIVSRNVTYKKPPPIVGVADEKKPEVQLDMGTATPPRTSRGGTRPMWGNVKARITNVLGAFRMLSKGPDAAGKDDTRDKA